MGSLSPRTRALLQRARNEATPSAEDLRRLRSNLAASLVSEAPDVAVLPFSLTNVGAFVLAAALGLGAWHAKDLVWPVARPTSPPVLAMSCPTVPAQASEPAFSCPQVSVGPVAADAPKRNDVRVVKCQSTPKEVVSADPAGSREAASVLSGAAGSKDRWALELGLLVDARRALDDERPLDALGLAQRHEALFPSTVFEEERLAVEVVAYCAIGQRDNAVARFERLNAAAPESSYLPRIRGVCGDGFTTPTETGHE